MEAHLQRPVAVGRMGIDHGAGLTSVPLGKLPLDSALVAWRCALLTVLPAGEPPRALGSHASARVLATLRERYEMVIVDAAPPVRVGELLR